MSTIKAVRYHDFCAGHRVVGHESKCRHLHGHNYRIHFYCEADNLDDVGRVIDFSEIKSTLCRWVEENFDHRFLAWEKDDLVRKLHGLINNGTINDEQEMFNQSIVWLPFNPTAENLADYILTKVAPKILPKYIRLTKVVLEETRKCSVECSI